MIYFHFPILSPVAGTAAEYAECAGEQGTEHFWEYVDAVYRNQRNITQQSLGELAAILDIDGQAMNQCVASGRHTAAWKSDLAYGRSLGVRANTDHLCRLRRRKWRGSAIAVLRCKWISTVCRRFWIRSRGRSGSGVDALSGIGSGVGSANPAQGYGMMHILGSLVVWVAAD